MANNIPTPHSEAWVLRQTNVSNPSVVIRTRPSQLSISASESYYSLSSSNNSTRSADLLGSALPPPNIVRYSTPPSRYRTPLQSRELLPAPLQPQSQHAGVRVEEDAPFRKTPMRGEGKRRSSNTQDLSQEPLPSQHQQQRHSGIQRKPVPGVMADMDRISPTHAQSSAAKDMDRESNAPTPDLDDTPYIHFALDQLTRDEEVRGSRHYPIQDPPTIYRQEATPINIPWPAALQPQHRYETVSQEEHFDTPRPHSLSLTQVAPARNPHRLSAVLHPQSERDLAAQSGPNLFIPAAHSRHTDFIPGTLRPLYLSMFLASLILYIACLVLAAVWSRINTGLLRYGAFGDGRYVLFQYIPALLGILLWFGLVQIITAVYRIAPFIAMSNASSPELRRAGQTLPLQPTSFFLPFLGHFRAGQPVIAVFLLLAWAQIFTIPLLGSAFNVYQDGQGQWQWIAVQGVIWTVIALYILLAIALIALTINIRHATTGLKWDPRNLADMIVLLERSNALDDAPGENVPKLGHWQSVHRPTDIFHTWGIENKPARSYGIEAGRITEKRYSNPDADLEAGGERLSKEAFLPKGTRPASSSTTPAHPSTPIPWFLTPFWALLWPVVALVLLLAFLIVAYLPTTSLRNPFAPLVPSAVSTFGFSGTNFLYSFLPTLLAMICLLGWMDLDFATRLLAPYASLTETTKTTLTSKSGRTEEVGDIAERTLLVSYSADMPILVTISAMVNQHYRVAITSFITLVAGALPILASGIWWAEFYIGVQRVGVSTHLPGFYALTVFVVIFALGWIFCSWQPASLRHSAHLLPEHVNTFAGIRELVMESQILDDVAFRAPVGRTDLVTRLLAGRAPRVEGVDGVESKRGSGDVTTAQGVRYGVGRWTGRDGRSGWVGLDRWRG